MAHVVDSELDLTPALAKRYFVSSAHRRVQFQKSKWTITIDDEINCFITSQLSQWIETRTSWGAIKNGTALINLGVNRFDSPLKFAKFIDSAGDDLWHGYPADYVRNQQDRPSMEILVKWRTGGIIEKHQILKIRQGKECNL